MTMQNNRGTKVGVVSLGCSKNRVDTEQMLGVLAEAGYAFEPDPAQADIIVVNTCGFIEPAKEESIDTILEMAEYKKTGRCRLLLVTGCLAQRYSEALHADIPEIDGMLGVGQYDKLLAMIAEADKGARPALTQPCDDFFESQRVLTTPSYSAYVKIGDGCDNRCSYCAIPLIRGGYRSRPTADIAAEVRRLTRAGVQEITLISQDTTRFGTDKAGGVSQLPALLREVSQIEGVHWLRTLYCYPARVDEALLDTMAALPNMCQYIDLPIQHIVPRLLTAMHRHGTAEHIRHLAQEIRARGMALRTSIIVGFPGETEADFEELLAFVAEARFDRLGAFAFSPEEDTVAAGLPDQIPEEIKQARLDRLMRLQSGISAERNATRVGTTCEVLVEGRRKDGLFVGRSRWEAPEIDGNVLFRATGKLRPGTFAQVRITGSEIYDLIGEAL